MTSYATRVAAAARAAGTPHGVAPAKRGPGILDTVRRAVLNRQVRLAYQPVVTAARPERPVFYEGLARVFDENGRTVPARCFIDEIETLEIGRELDCVALELGLKALAANPQLRLSINMSARSVGYRRWLQVLDRGLSATASLAGRLVLEITETSAMVMPDMVQSFMTGLQTEGIGFALDDFGAGYTSFRYLKSFYFDFLKIDGQYIREISTDPDNQVLVEALVGIGRQFGMYTVAENVESEADARFLAAAGVDLLQGHLFGSPMLKPDWEAAPPSSSNASVGG